MIKCVVDIRKAEIAKQQSKMLRICNIEAHWAVLA